MLQNEAERLFPAPGCQKLISVDDEAKCHMFCEKPTATNAAADSGWGMEGLHGRISGGNSKQGFPTKRGVLTHGWAPATEQGPFLLQTKENWREKV